METDQNKIEQVIDDAATEWVNAVVPKMYEVLERASITYSEDLLCEALADGFKAGAVWALEMGKHK